VPSGANFVVYAGLLIGLVYGASGSERVSCLMSSLRGCGRRAKPPDPKLSLALGVAIAATQLLRPVLSNLRANRSNLQPSFFTPPDVLWRLLFGYGHGAVERLRLACAGAARARQSRSFSWDRARHNSANDADRPGRAARIALLQWLPSYADGATCRAIWSHRSVQSPRVITADGASFEATAARRSASAATGLSASFAFMPSTITDEPSADAAPEQHHAREPQPFDSTLP